MTDQVRATQSGQLSPGRSVQGESVQAATARTTSGANAWPA